jgi:hypothetical protein
MSNKNDQTEDHSSHNEELNNTKKQPSSTISAATADPDNDSVTTGRIAAKERGSASATKTTVAGSDLDGQTSF